MLRRFPLFPTRSLAGSLAAASLVLVGTLPALAQTTASDNDSAPATTGQKNSQQKPASKRLPEPKASDYAASTFNAPSDDALDQFMATHQPPKPAKPSSGSNASGGKTAAAPAANDNAAPGTATAGASSANGGA